VLTELYVIRFWEETQRDDHTQIYNKPFLLEGDDDDDDNDDDNNNNNNCVYRTVTSLDVLGIGRILKLSKLPVLIKLVTFSSTVCAASLECKQHG
jgi:hypothetical protein